MIKRNSKGRFVKGSDPINFKGVIWKECPNCKKEFYVTLKNKKNKFCSMNCGAIYNGRKRKGKNLSGIYFKCHNCKKETYRCKGSMKKSKHFFCSKKCNYIWRKGKIFSTVFFKKGNKPWNKGRKWDEMYGKERADELRKEQIEKKMGDWKDLEHRKLQMKSRTPAKLKNFRDAAGKHNRSKKNIERLKKVGKKRKVIDLILKNEN